MKNNARIIILFFLILSVNVKAQDIVYINVSELIRSTEIEVITPDDKIQRTLVEMTPDNDVRITYPDQTIRFFKDKTMGHSIIIKKELEKWIREGYTIETSHVSAGITNEGIGISRYTVYVLIREKE